MDSEAKGHWTPYEMEILLHHHVSFGRFPRHDAPAYGETVPGLVRLGLLEWIDVEQTHRTTPLGCALIGMWLTTPIPVAKWVDPRFEGDA